MYIFIFSLPLHHFSLTHSPLLLPLPLFLFSFLCSPYPPIPFHPPPPVPPPCFALPSLHSLPPPPSLKAPHKFSVQFMGHLNSTKPLNGAFSPTLTLAGREEAVFATIDRMVKGVGIFNVPRDNLEMGQGIANVGKSRSSDC